MDIPVFAKFDHQKNAEEVGLDLRPNQVIVFGSPKVGTKLMQENPAISIELPLKISVWEDKNGKVWTSFPQMERLASEYGLEKNRLSERCRNYWKRLSINLPANRHLRTRIKVFRKNSFIYSFGTSITDYQNINNE